MSDSLSPMEPGQEPLKNPTASATVLLQAADDALRRQLWEPAIQSYQAALKAAPGEISARMGLGRAYEGKSRDKDGEPFLLLAMEQYRQALKIDPGRAEAHDALLSAATRSHKLDDMLAEYRVRIDQDPANEACRATLKKIEALVLLGTSAPVTAGPEPHRLTWLLLDRLLPFITLACFLGAFLSRLQSHSTLSAVLFRSSFFLLAVYLFYKLVVRRS